MRCCVSNVVEVKHGFDQFGKVVDDHDNVLVSITIWMAASHEFDAPFAKWVDSDD
jgi:hypothetical protein